MRLTDPAVDARGLDAMVASHVLADYVYMYPPRQAYRDIDPSMITGAVSRSLERTRSIDLYLHFPFCRQICAFCNLYAVVSTSASAFEEYVDVLLREAAWYAPLVEGTPVDTVYLGGGTPSQLEARLFERLFNDLERQYRFNREDVPEVAIEMAPDTVSAQRLADYVSVGINRVNLGVQTTSDAELHGIGRKHSADLSLHAVELALAAGFANVCVDLIYGLKGQDFDSWCRSVDTLIGLEPPTICAYALTLRPWTGFAARGFHEVDPAAQVAKYEYVDGALRAAGYAQETHVRWVKGPRGGYLQKANHWALGSLLGLGAGARGYLWECDYRNGYSARHRTRVLREWYANIARHGHGRIDGYIMTEDERRRKAIILGLHDLDFSWFSNLFGCSPLELFPTEFEALIDGEYGVLDERRFHLTARGLRHRDVLVQAFISPLVRELCNSFDYAA